MPFNKQICIHLFLFSPFKKKVTAELQTQLVDVLLKDNDSLTKALRTVTQEKAELCRAVSQLEKSLKQHLLKRGMRNVRRHFHGGPGVQSVVRVSLRFAACGV